jgi:hypothetical protein
LPTRTITREELYEKAWSTPMSKLAQEFGLSDVDLKKVCRRNGIPTPGLGYWRLLETGHIAKRAPLQPIQSGQRQTISITARERGPFEIVEPKTTCA